MRRSLIVFILGLQGEFPTLHAMFPPFYINERIALQYGAFDLNGVTVERIFKSENGKTDTIWEYSERTPWSLWAQNQEKVVAARNFGSIYCIVIKGGVIENLQYIRIDTTPSQASWIRTWIPWDTKQGRLHPPVPVIENTEKISMEPTDGGKATFHIYPDGKLDRNGLQLPSTAIINGKLVEHDALEPGNARRVWPPENREQPTPSMIESRSSSAKSYVSNAIISDAVHFPNLDRMGKLWFGILAIPIAVAGWLVFHRWKASRK